MTNTRTNTTTYLAIATIVLGLFLSTIAFANAGQEKVTICHKGHEITVGAPAVDAHVQNHGDTIGSCDPGPDPDPQ